jgi:CRP-like cAMP-binding protein
MIQIMQEVLTGLFAGARVLEAKPGLSLFATGQRVEHVYLVTAGSVQLQRVTPHGALLILQTATAGAVLAEASAWSTHYHCDAVTAAPSVLAALPKGAFLSALRRNSEAALAWSAMLARAVQSARVRAEIRSLPKLSDRLDAWLSEGNTLPEKGRWQDVAAELGVTREALYRELARRR